MHISTSNIKYSLKEKIRLYLNEEPKRQGIAQSQKGIPVSRPNANTDANANTSPYRNTISQEDSAETDTLRRMLPTVAKASDALARSIYGDKESIERDAQAEADKFQGEVESSGRGQAIRDADAEAKKITDKFDADFLAKGGTEQGVKAAQDGTSADGSVEVKQKQEQKQEQNIDLKVTAESGNTRVKGGSVTLTSGQSQSMKGIDPRSPGYDEQNQDVSLEVKNAAVPRVEGSKSDSLLNKKMQELATRRQGYIKLGKVDIDVNQQQGTGPSADALTGAAQGSRGTSTPAVTQSTSQPSSGSTPTERVSPIGVDGIDKRTGRQATVQAQENENDKVRLLKVAGQMNVDRLQRVKERVAKEQGNGPSADILTGAAQGSRQAGGATTTGQDGSTRTTRTTQNGNETREEEISQYDAANDPSKKAARKVMGLE